MAGNRAVSLQGILGYCQMWRPCPTWNFRMDLFQKYGKNWTHLETSEACKIWSIHKWFEYIWIKSSKISETNCFQCHGEIKNSGNIFMKDLTNLIESWTFRRLFDLFVQLPNERKENMPRVQRTTSLPIFLLMGFNSGCSWCSNTVFLLCEVRRTNELPMRIADSEDTLPAILVAPKKRNMQLLAMVKDNVVEVAPRNCLYKDVEEQPTKFWPFIRSYMLSMALQKQHFEIFWESGVAGCIGAR